MSDEQIIEIETKLTHQEDLLAQLNDALTQQQAQISELERRCRVLNDKIDALAESSGAEPGSEKPPHY